MSADVAAIETFLRRVDGDFPVPLSQKQDLHSFARKLAESATICFEEDETGIIAMVAGYTDNLVGGMAYVSIAATVAGARGKGLATKLMREFMDICVIKKISALHLYAVASNLPAMSMYRKLGFSVWDCPNDPRPGDAHLIKYL